MELFTFAIHDQAGKITAFYSNFPQQDFDATIANSNIDASRYVKLPAYSTISPSTQYVVDDGVMPRPELTPELDGMTLKGIPAGATLTIEGVDYEADGSDIELSFSHAGTYTVAITAFPYRDTSITVTYED